MKRYLSSPSTHCRRVACLAHEGDEELKSFVGDEPEEAELAAEDAADQVCACLILACVNPHARPTEA
jgi:hypothetical protein